jgi:deoxyribonuclease-4
MGAIFSDSNIYRVRNVISKLKYKTLVQSNVVPDLYPFFDVQTKRYPMWVYNAKNPKKGNFDQIFSCMGLFYDGLVRKMLSQVIKVDWGTDCPVSDVPLHLKSSTVSWTDSAFPFMEHLLGMFGRSDLVEYEQFKKMFSHFGALNKTLSIWFQAQIQSQQTIEFNTEFAVERDGVTIAGHPDLVIGSCVIDIKTSSGFNSMADQTFMQILAYVALMRANGREVCYAGVLLPLQCQQIIIDLSRWDHLKYLDKLFDASDILRGVQGVQPEFPRVGHTTSKVASDWPTSLRKYVTDCGEILPAQILLTGRMVGITTLSDAELAEICQTVESLGLHLFNHGPYTINLAKPWTKKNPHDTTWGIRSCIASLEASRAIGARGVVIHTGKHTDVLDYATGYNNLINNLRTVIAEATAECPLMLETPVGCGTEIGAKIEEFNQIYESFTLEERTRFKVCIDTCHVFAAGYDPYDYLVKWDQLQGYQSIGLVHFNDSKEGCGSHKDRHNYYTISGGQIGYEVLKNVAIWCNERNVPMVTE